MSRSGVRGRVEVAHDVAPLDSARADQHGEVQGGELSAQICNNMLVCDKMSL
jgi:hypothetical protein